METTIYAVDGTQHGEATLPTQFNEYIRTDLIKNAVTAIQQNRRQPYGAKPDAGLRHVTRDRKRRRAYRTFKGRGVSRTPQKIFLSRGDMFHGEGAEAPNTRGGRQAHPPTSEKDFSRDMNRREKQKAVRAALAATADRETVKERGHEIDDVDTLPLIVSAAFEQLETTQEVMDALHSLGLTQELERCSPRKVRGGKGTMRNRKYKQKTGPLLVAADTDTLYPAARNIPGVTIVEVENLNAALLAPGTHPGRLTVYTKPAIQTLENQDLFTS